VPFKCNLQRYTKDELAKTAATLEEVTADSAAAVGAVQVIQYMMYIGSSKAPGFKPRTCNFDLLV
jgi:hypothetical protein